MTEEQKEFANEPAFPQPMHCIAMGLTKREYLAASALPSVLISCPEYIEFPKDAAKYCVEIADAMIAQLSEG